MGTEYASEKVALSNHGIHGDSRIGGGFISGFGDAPDTDALRAAYRDGVHFNAVGMQRYGELRAEKAGVWLDHLARSD